MLTLGLQGRVELGLAGEGSWACVAEGSWACAALEGSSWAGARSTHNDTRRFGALVLLCICFDAEDVGDAGGRSSGSGGGLRDSGEEGRSDRR